MEHAVERDFVPLLRLALVDPCVRRLRWPPHPWAESAPNGQAGIRLVDTPARKDSRTPLIPRVPLPPQSGTIKLCSGDRSIESCREQSQCVEGDEHRGAGVGEDGRPQAGDAGDGSDQENCLEPDCDRDVLGDVAHDPA